MPSSQNPFLWFCDLGAAATQFLVVLSAPIPSIDTTKPVDLIHSSQVLF